MAWIKIGTIITNAINKYHTTLESDIQLLIDSSTLTFNTRNCLLLRVGEKKILHFLLEFSNFVAEISSMNKKDAMAHLEDKKFQFKYLKS